MPLAFPAPSLSPQTPRDGTAPLPVPCGPFSSGHFLPRSPVPCLLACVPFAPAVSSHKQLHALVPSHRLEHSLPSPTAKAHMPFTILLPCLIFWKALPDPPGSAGAALRPGSYSSLTSHSSWLINFFYFVFFLEQRRYTPHAVLYPGLNAESGQSCNSAFADWQREQRQDEGEQGGERTRVWSIPRLISGPHPRPLTVASLFFKI